MKKISALFLAAVMTAMLTVNAFASSINKIITKYNIIYYIEAGKCAEDTYLSITPMNQIKPEDTIILTFDNFSYAKLFDGWSASDFEEGGAYEFGTLMGYGHSYNELIGKYNEGVAEGFSSSQSSQEVLYDFWSGLSADDDLCLPYLIKPVSDTEIQVELFPLPEYMCDVTLTSSSGASSKASYIIPLTFMQGSGSGSMIVDIEKNNTNISSTAVTFGYSYNDDSSDRYSALSFELNNGSSADSVNIFRNTPLYIASIPEKEGYTFEGWYTDESLSTKFVQGSEASNRSITFYANWVEEGSEETSSDETADTEGDYTVSFETNGGSEIDSIDVVLGSAVVIPVPPTKEGCEFEGWYTDSDFTTPYKTTVQITSDLTLYAKWSGETDYILGDVTGDGEILSDDATRILLYYAKRIELTDAQLKAADVTGDGEVLSDDAARILLYYAKRITQF